MCSSGGGTSVASSPSGQSFLIGFRLGRVLTNEHGGGFLRGTFEMAGTSFRWTSIGSTALKYAAAINPFIAKWNFTSAGKVAPYIAAVGGVLFSTHNLPLREKVIYDGALPSSNSVAAMNLLRLGRMTANPEFEKQADLLMKSFAERVAALPAAYTHFMQALDFALGPAREILIAGDISSPATKQMIETVHRLYSPNRVLMLKDRRKTRRGFIADRAVYRPDNFRGKRPRCLCMRELQLPKSRWQRLRVGVHTPGRLSKVERLNPNLQVSWRYYGGIWQKNGVIVAGLSKCASVVSF